MAVRILLGDLTSDELVEPVGDISIAQKQPIFEPVVTFFTALMGFAALAEVYDGTGKPLSPWGPDSLAILDAAACDLRLRTAPHLVASRMLRNWWPDSISFATSSRNLPHGDQLNLGAFDHFLFGLTQAMFTTVFENHRSSIDARFGTRGNWPPEWQFAAVVRNALSHGGRLDIRHSTHVAWKKLAYTQSDHGREIINRDLWPGDMIVLLNEMQSSLI